MSGRPSGARVLHLLGPSTGGIRSHVAALAEALEAGGWSIGTAGPAGVLGELRPLDHVVPVGTSPGAVLRGRAALRRAAAGADLVHAHGLTAGWLAVVASLDAPVVASVHNLVLDDVAGRAAPLLRALEGALPGRLAAGIAVSGEVARRFTGVPGAGRLHVVPPLGPAPVVTRPSADVRAELGVAPGGHLVVTAARLHPQKGLHDLLEAARRLAPRVEGLRWVVLGEGPERSALEAAIRRHGLDDVVHLAGQRRTIADELAAADVVAVTSRWESGPLVVLEALALGRPVAATAVGLVPDVVGGVRGRVVPVGDATAMADAVAALLASSGAHDDSDGEPAGGGRGRYGPADLVPPIEALYREVLQRR